MAEERFAAEGYKIIQSVEINGMEVVVAENPDAHHQFMEWRRSLDQPFGAEDHLIPVFGNDYLDIFKEFIRCQSVYADGLALDRVYRTGDVQLYKRDCVLEGMKNDLKNKVVVIKAEILSPEYQTASHQLMLATDGFGCSPEARGKAVFGVNIYSGNKEQWTRYDILGVMDEEKLPIWAREKLSRLREPREKESVIAKIREARAAAKTEPPTERKPKTHDKTGPEL